MKVSLTSFKNSWFRLALMVSLSCGHSLGSCQKVFYLPAIVRQPYRLTAHFGLLGLDSSGWTTPSYCLFITSKTAMFFSVNSWHTCAWEEKALFFLLWNLRDTVFKVSYYSDLEVSSGTQSEGQESLWEIRTDH